MDNKPPEPEIATLSKLLRQILNQVGSFVGKGFLPADQIDDFTTYDTVNQVLAEAKVSNPCGVANYVVQKRAQKLFLSLVCCDRVEWMQSLSVSPLEICDDHLPVHFDADDERLPLVTINALESSHEGEPWPVDLNVNTVASMMAKNVFVAAQWCFLSPIFTREKFYHEFEDGIRLPFVQTFPITKSGSFGFVREVELHHAHQTVIAKTSSQHLRVALKEIYPNEPDLFPREMEVLHGIQAIIHAKPNLHLITPLASYRFKGSRTGFLMFPWADGGNLKDFWAREENRHGVVLVENYWDSMKWTLEQMRGLCEALVELHKDRISPSGEMTHCRHGDLKPENILVFWKNDSEMLHIADLGLGKFHGKSTDDRKKQHEYTKTQTGTTRYMPPEFGTNKQISRAHDVWSLGCLFFEFVIWAARGVEGLDKFIKSKMEEFWCWNDNGLDVHYDVKIWMKNLRWALEETALGDVLEMVDLKMLKAVDERCSSQEIHKWLSQIIERAKSDVGYCSSDALRSKIRNHTLPDIKSDGNSGPGLSGNYKKSEVKELEDTWQHHTDNEFTRGLWKHDQGDTEATSSHTCFAKPESVHKPILCSRCSGLDLWQPDFHVSDRVSTLASTSKTCQLCKLIHESLEDISLPENIVEVVVRRNGPVMEVHPGKRVILTLYTGQGLTAYTIPSIVNHLISIDSKTPAQGLFQIGTPQLPVPGSKEQFALFKEWLRVCDTGHNHAISKVAPSTSGQHEDRPTRVIDVGSLSNPSIRLLKGKDMESLAYLALSHRWGDNRDHHLGRTLCENQVERLLNIEWNELPLNFQDAITVTRNLGVRYLWIDSICIIQDDDDDWKRESMKMEQVYSNAMCILAACSAKSSIEGFLKRSTSRPFVALQSESGDIGYICKSIDNFQRDVDEAILHTRGWTLQERALARRTIHFTETQVYFECGECVRCESLVRLTNGRSVLADSNFPTSIESRYDGGRVMLVQSLFTQYSKRSFWDAQDRPIAISGLEKRLTSAFHTRGGYGVFEAFLGRSLLWKRDDDTQFLKLIPFPSERNVPTWSWMAYDGTISYIHADFGEVDWMTEYSSPFDSGSGASGKKHWEADGTNRPPILGLSKVRQLDLVKGSDELLDAIVFDIPGREKQAEDLRCVVIGKTKPKEQRILTCFVLIVKLSSDKALRGVYLRVGAGILLESQIRWDCHEAGNLH